MPRILCVLNRLVIGGPAMVATYLAKYLPSGFETVMVIGGKDDHEKDATHLTNELGIKPIIIPEMKRAISWKEDRAAYKRMKQIISEFKPDIVHTHAAKSGAIGRMAASAMKVPVIVHTFHGHVFHSYFHPLKTKAFIQAERYLAGRSNGIIAISKQQKDELVNTYKICPEEKVRIIHIGLDLDQFHFQQQQKREAFRSAFQIEENEIAIGIVGRIVPIKNHSLFVAAARIVLKNTDKKIRFVVVGDGDRREAMEAEFGNAGIDYTYYLSERRKATAICTSWQTEMDIVFAGLDIVALTSNNEGTPVSLIEAQAAGKPVVSTNVGGVSNVVMENESGFLSPSGNAEALAHDLLELVNNPDLRKKFGEKGRAFVLENFSYQKMVAGTAQYYQELLLKKTF